MKQEDNPPRKPKKKQPRRKPLDRVAEVVVTLGAIALGIEQIVRTGVTIVELLTQN